MSRARHLKSAAGQGEKGVGPAKTKPAVNLPGVEVMKEADKSKAGFKKGGAVKDAGCAPGMKSKSRMDKMPRKADGGAVTMRGRSPYSSAANISGAD